MSDYVHGKYYELVMYEFRKIISCVQYVIALSRMVW